ncbi:hypothetical protein PHMEG_0004430 [Phytophthora megakarya]|uniref:Uncharacterized protein n=1 Tax=Phytophthora megakarya TaxID=4795 RepID=A0A225WVI2_9STRA|nr:hypothetical protein PHMEG_0004430 [Phytophthora megakarya]
MAPKISRAFSINERHNNPSILVQDMGHGDLDLGDCWNGRDATSASHWRVSLPENMPRRTTTWSSRFTSLSSNVRNAGAVLATRAKQLRVPRSTRWTIPKPTMVATPETSMPRAISTPTQVVNDSDIDSGDEPDEEQSNDKPTKLYSSFRGGKPSL